MRANNLLVVATDTAIVSARDVVMFFKTADRNSSFFPVSVIAECVPVSTAIVPGKTSVTAGVAAGMVKLDAPGASDVDTAGFELVSAAEAVTISTGTTLDDVMATFVRP